MEINQSLRFAESYSMITSNKRDTVKINIEVINNDIDKLSKMYKETQNNYDKINITAILNLIAKLKKSLNNNELRLDWSTEKRYLKQYVELAKIPEYGIDMTDYIVLQNEVLVNVDLTEVSNIIAFDMMHRDMGFTTEEIEQELSNSSLASENPESTISKLYKNDKIKPYMLSKDLRFSDSPYYSVEEKYLLDYFYCYKYKDVKTYKDSVYDSCRTAMSLVALNIIKNMKEAEKKIDQEEKSDSFIKFVHIGGTSVTFITNKDISDIRKYIEYVNVRSFGRRFQVNPKITIY